MKSFNAYLDNLQNKVFEAHWQLTEKAEPITAQRLRYCLDHVYGLFEIKATRLKFELSHQ